MRSGVSRGRRSWLAREAGDTGLAGESGPGGGEWGWLTWRGAACPEKTHLVDVRVPRHGLARDPPHAVDEVEHARRIPSRLDELGEEQRRQRRLLGGLEHDRAPGSERGADLPCQHEDRVVPRHDLPDDAGVRTLHTAWSGLLPSTSQGDAPNRLLPCHSMLLLIINLDRLPMDLISPSGVVPETSHRVLHIDACPWSQHIHKQVQQQRTRPGLVRIDDLERRQLVNIGLDLVRKREQQPPPLLPADIRAPRILECGARGGDGKVDVLGGGGLDLPSVPPLDDNVVALGTKGGLTVATTSSVAGSTDSRVSPRPGTHSLLMNRPVWISTPATVILSELIVRLA